MEEKQKYFRIHRDEIIKKEVYDMEREKTRKQNLMSLEVQYQMQEEKKLIKMMETAYLGAHRGQQWDAARLVLAKNAKMIVYVPERKPQPPLEVLKVDRKKELKTIKEECSKDISEEDIEIVPKKKLGLFGNTTSVNAEDYIPKSDAATPTTDDKMNIPLIAPPAQEDIAFQSQDDIVEPTPEKTSQKKMVFKDHDFYGDELDQPAETSNKIEDEEYESYYDEEDDQQVDFFGKLKNLDGIVDQKKM